VGVSPDGRTGRIVYSANQYRSVVIRMVTQRIEKVATLITFGFVMVVETVVTGELGYLPTDLLVKFGLGVGACMVLGSGYALMIPAKGMGAILRSRASAPSNLPTAA
jgi:hypothetical protein